MFFNWRENAVFHILVKGLFSLGRSCTMINLLGALNCFTYLGMVFSFESNSGKKKKKKMMTVPRVFTENEIWLQGLVAEEAGKKER